MNQDTGGTPRLITTKELAGMLRVTPNAIAHDRMRGGQNYPPFIKLRKTVL